MKKMNFLSRFTLFNLILGFGTMVALLLGESTGLALADLSNTSVPAMTRVSNGDTLYAALGNHKQGIYRSNDSGHSWQLISRGPHVEINALATSPKAKNMLYAGTAGGFDSTQASLWYSSNGGKNWKQYEYSLPTSANGQYPAVNVLTVDPNRPGILYIGTEGQGIYRVQSGYGGYTPVGGAPFQNLYVKDIVVTVDSPIYAVTTEGLLVIEGDAWRKIETLPDGAVSLAVDPVNPNTLYVGTVGYGAYRSTDGGQTWQAINNGLSWQPGVLLRVSAIAVDRDNPQHVALATAYSVGSHLLAEGIFESFDAGQNWSQVADIGELVKRLTIKDGGIYAVTANGLTRYGAPLSPAPMLQFRNLFSNPTAMQGLVLVLTIVFAGLVLLGRVEWPFKRHQTTV